ncbi:MAG TPA: hypothetical protein VFP52_01215, partial [Myxococcales bacterium]|nr:hypothetical protein [Myxococcales bacterium]
SVSAYDIPTEKQPESDGTAVWSKTTLVLVELKAGTWERALRADRPVLVEAMVDPDFPMMPPHVTLKEAKAYARSVVRGDPDARHMIGETIKTAVASVFEKGKKDR